MTAVNVAQESSLIPLDDGQRVEALRRYNLLEGPPDAYFQNIVHQAAEHFNVPIALISLVDKDDVYFRGNAGMQGISKLGRNISLCSFAVLSSKPTVFTKPLDEPCLVGNPLVHKEFGIKFYAAAPLITPEGYRIGAVTLVDKEEREFSDKQQVQLVRYAAMVMHDMELRLSVQKREQELEKEIKHRQKLVTNAVLVAQENERSRMGIELHDNVNQILTTVKLYNEMALDPYVDTESILKKSSEYLQECIDEIRFISKQLSAPTLGDIELSDSIKELINSINCWGKIIISFNNKLVPTLPIGQEVHINVYRIIQEQLNNIIKHANATHVAVNLSGDNDEIKLVITDNGVGFDTSIKRTGIGITNMKTRCENLNGKFDIRSAKGEGCKLTVSVPCFSKN